MAQDEQIWGETKLSGTVASQYLLNTYDALEKLGCAPGVLLNGVPGGDKALHNPATRFEANTMLDMFHRAEASSGIVGIGVLAGDHPRLSALDELGYAMIASNTLEEMIKLYRKYQPLLQEIYKTDVLKSGTTASVVLEHQPCDPNYLRPYAERFFGAVATFGRWVTWDQNMEISKVSFAHSAPSDLSAYKKIFNCELAFDAPRTEMIVSRALMEHPLPQPNPALVASISKRLDVALAELGSPLTTTRETFILIKAMLPDGPPSIVSVADAMATTERTLRRRLKEEETTFVRVLESARRDECELLISRGIIAPSALSDALGYSETSAFTRAFKGWYGVPPSKYLKG